jgi:hypothetical protein
MARGNKMRLLKVLCAWIVRQGGGLTVDEFAELATPIPEGWDDGGPERGCFVSAFVSTEQASKAG